MSEKEVVAGSFARVTKTQNSKDSQNDLYIDSIVKVIRIVDDLCLVRYDQIKTFEYDGVPIEVLEAI